MNKFLQFILVVILAVATSYYFEGRPKGYKIDKLIDFKNLNFTDDNYQQTINALENAYNKKDTVALDSIIYSIPPKYLKEADINYFIAKYYLLKKDTLSAYYSLTFDDVKDIRNVSNDTTYLLFGMLIAKYTKFQYDEAINCFQLFLEKHPDSDSALFLIGKTNYKQQYYSSAIEYFNEAIKLNPKNIKNIGPMFDAYTLINDSIQTLNYLNYLNQQYPNQKEIMIELAKYYMWNIISSDSAYFFTQKVLKIEPTNIWANYIMAAIKFQKKQFKEALKYIDISYQLDTTYPYTCQLKGWILFHLDDFENAEIWLDKTINLFGNDEPKNITYYYLAYSCQKLKKYQKAIKYYSKYVTKISDQEQKSNIYNTIDELDKNLNK